MSAAAIKTLSKNVIIYGFTKTFFSFSPFEVMYPSSLRAVAAALAAGGLFSRGLVLGLLQAFWLHSALLKNKIYTLECPVGLLLYFYMSMRSTLASFFCAAMALLIAAKAEASLFFSNILYMIN